MNLRKEFNSGLDATTVCSQDTSHGVFVATFGSSDECNKYTQTPIFGAPSAYTYGNCSIASYCMTFDSPFTGSLKGFNLTGVTAQGFSYATLGFETMEDCNSAHKQGTIDCSGQTVCNNSALILTDCTYGQDSTGSFSIPTGEMLTFDFLP